MAMYLGDQKITPAIVKITTPSSDKETHLRNIIKRTATEITEEDLEGATSIPQFAFYKYSTLKKVSIPKGVTSIGKSAFSNTGLTKVSIPDGVITIDDDAFNGCKLTSITIPDSVTSIGDLVFNSCSKLADITIGKGVSTIGSLSFYGNISIENVYISDLSAWCKIVFADTTSTPMYRYGSFIKNIYLNNTLITDLIIPDDITVINAYAFSGWRKLNTITIHNNISSIGTRAFHYCDSVSSITYNGTIEQWNAITKEDEWNLNCSATYIQCTDGQVQL